MSAVYIGIGIILFLWISFSLHRKRKNRNKVICVVDSNCTGCRRCVKRCQRHVLEVVEDEAGKRAAVKYPDKCTACGDCLGKCKFNALKLIERA
jgi:NAD-dependent dihydropyrimidine dehydrogenase PreA subunit